MNTPSYPLTVHVHRLVEVRANETPGAIALVMDDKTLTYGELNDRANQLAHLLRSLGVGPEVPVGLCVRRSFDLVIGALGILKAGGAYIPLDPLYPPSRLSLLLNDSQTPVLVTQACVAERLPSGEWRTVMLNDASECPIATPVNEATIDNLAYIIYTSGSTGRPKGVQVTHKNLLNLIAWHQRAFDVKSADRAMLQASPGFDAAVWEIWPYLTAGAVVYLVDEAVRSSPEALRDWMVGKGITIGFLPTALAERMIGLQWPHDTALRVLLTGADTLRRYPPVTLPFTLVNNYGPTECTVVATSGTVHASERTDELPSIGRPIDNTQVYIVDEQLRPVPLGVPGELLIGGGSVARGYLNLPQLTGEKFVSDSFSKEPGARLYRTGDLARYREDGQIDFMGRIDEQIKIRGYRVEPHEITTLLDRHPNVKASLVAAYEDASGEKSLVAYVVPTAEGGLKASSLRSFLSEHLPDYMVPSAFIQIEALPFSAHGKLDRAALPKVTADNVLQDMSFEGPQSPLEERIAAILSSLLGVKRIGVDDNFFDLGGHSLLGAQTIARIRDAFGVTLSLRSLFDHPTVRGISDEVKGLIVAELDAMSEDEAQRLVASLQDKG